MGPGSDPPWPTRLLLGNRGIAEVATDVFISYRRSDREFAVRLSECLRARGVSHWYDGMIGPAEDWRDEIVANIKLAKILLILFSKEANASNELKKELAVADQSQTLIVVVRVENVLPKEGYAYELGTRNWLDAFDNPRSQLVDVANIVARVLENPGDLKKRFAKSASELKRRRRRQLLGHYGLLRNSAFLVGVFLVVSLVQYFLYDKTQGAVSELVRGGTDPLLAVVAVAFAVSIGSPLLLLQALRQNLTGFQVWLIPCSVVNLLLLLALARNFVAWVYVRTLDRDV